MWDTWDRVSDRLLFVLLGFIPALLAYLGQRRTIRRLENRDEASEGLGHRRRSVEEFTAIVDALKQMNEDRQARVKHLEDRLEALQRQHAEEVLRLHERHRGEVAELEHECEDLRHRLRLTQDLLDRIGRRSDHHEDSSQRQTNTKRRKGDPPS
jgi:DNA repair exonuclease SbcCD ATPase subunit